MSCGTGAIAYKHIQRPHLQCGHVSVILLELQINLPIPSFDGIDCLSPVDSIPNICRKGARVSTVCKGSASRRKAGAVEMRQSMGWKRSCKLQVLGHKQARPWTSSLVGLLVAAVRAHVSCFFLTVPNAHLGNSAQAQVAEHAFIRARLRRNHQVKKCALVLCSIASSLWAQEARNIRCIPEPNEALTCTTLSPGETRSLVLPLAGSEATTYTPPSSQPRANLIPKGLSRYTS